MVNMDESRVLYVRGIGKAVSKVDLTIYFQSRKHSDGGDISSVELREGEAVITFEESYGAFDFNEFLAYMLHTFAFFALTYVCIFA